VRYAGSIERLDLGERQDDKSVVLLDVGAGGLRGEPVLLPLEATPIYDVEMHTPLKNSLEVLRRLHPDAHRDLVHVQFTYTAGVDNLQDTLSEIEAIFPRWYSREWSEASALGPSLTVGDAARAQGFEDTVRDYVRQELANHPPEESEAVLARLEILLKEIAE
jgi:DNA repair exonuclease SbcCD nuclease subunit